jgi:DNA-binding transcriptional ArsR family regulator
VARYDDPRILRAIAHPQRNRILAELLAAGSLRATDVASLLDIPANQASFHLRQLAKYGLVVEAPEEARDRRDRVWRLAEPDGITFRTQEVLARPGGEAAMAVFQRSARAWGHHLVDMSLAPAEPGVEKTVSSNSLRLTQEEVVEYARDVEALINRWRERTAGGGPGRTTYSIYQLIQPYPDLPDPEVQD